MELRHSVGVWLIVLAALFVPRAHGEADPIEVTLELRVSNAHRLSLEAVESDAAIAALAHKSFPNLAEPKARDAARKFVAQIVTELNDQMKSWEPLPFWKIGSNLTRSASGESGVVVPTEPVGIAPANLTTVPLHEWLRVNVKPLPPGASAETTATPQNFAFWMPTVSSEEDGPKNAQIGDRLRDLCGGLGAYLDVENQLESTGDSSDDRIPMRIRPLESISALRLAQCGPPGDSDEGRLLAAELRGAAKVGDANAGRLAWLEDLVVQRLMVVLRARGLWIDPETPRRGQWRHVNWFLAEGETVVIGVPHLVSISYELPLKTRTNRKQLETEVRKILELVLTKEEQDTVGMAFDLREKYPSFDSLPIPDLPLGRIVQFPRNRREVRIDLFALAEYRGELNAQRPLSQARNDNMLERIREFKTPAGAPVSCGLTSKPLPGPGRHGRLKGAEEFFLGGVELKVLGNRPPDAGTTGTDPEQADADKQKLSPLREWLHRQKLRFQAGATKEASQPLKATVVLSTTDAPALGQFELALSYSRRLSAQFAWTPGSEMKSELLPTGVSVFESTGPRRVIDGSDFELQSKGVGVSKSWSNLTPELDARLRGVTLGVEAARVHDLAVVGSPTLDQFKVTLDYSSSRHGNAWDAREFDGYRFAITGAGRGKGSLNVWAVADASRQVSRTILGGQARLETFLQVRSAAGQAPTDELPYIGGTEVVRGVRTFAVPARNVALARTEFWLLPWFIGRDYGSSQSRFSTLYDTLKYAVFVDAAWAGDIHGTESIRPWFFSPGAGLRFNLGPMVLNLDYAYGLTRPAQLGGSRVVFGASGRF